MIDYLTLPSPFIVFQAPNPTDPSRKTKAFKTAARGINIHHVVVGTLTENGEKGSPTHGFRWDSLAEDPEKMTIIDVLPDDVQDAAGKNLPVKQGSTIVAGINDYGDIVGQFQLADAEQHEYGFWRDPGGNFTVIDLSANLGGEAGKNTIGTNVTCINNRRNVAGRVYYPTPFASGRVFHGFLVIGDGTRVGGKFLLRDAEPAFTEIYGINDHNDVAGVTGMAKDDLHAYYQWMADTEPPAAAVPIDDPLWTFSRGRGINGGRKIVGQLTLAEPPSISSPGAGFQFGPMSGDPLLAFHVVTATNPISLWFGPFVAATSTYAHGINDSGFVVGEFTDSREQRWGFILNPMVWSVWNRHTRNRFADPSPFAAYPAPPPTPVDWWQRARPTGTSDTGVVRKKR